MVVTAHLWAHIKAYKMYSTILHKCRGNANQFLLWTSSNIDAPSDYHEFLPAKLCMGKVLLCEVFLETKSRIVTMLDQASHMNILMVLGIRGS